MFSFFFYQFDSIVPNCIENERCTKIVLSNETVDLRKVCLRMTKPNLLKVDVGTSIEK